MRNNFLTSLIIFSCIIIFSYPTVLFTQVPTSDIAISGFQYLSEFGYSNSCAGDVNGDGYEDIIVGARNYDNVELNEGRVYIFHGSAVGLITTPAITLEINQANAYFGFSVDGAGDVNNDGYDDIIIGAYAFDEGQTDEGKIFIYHGSPSGILATPATTIQGNQTSAYFGYSVAGAHDVNNDGYDDVVVGSYYYDNGQTNEGVAFLYLGSSTGINVIPVNTLESNYSFTYFGNSVDGAGDVNGDGYSDLIIGAYHMYYGSDSEGAAYIYYGNSTGVNTVTYKILDSDQTNAYFGTSVSEAGDINNDGFDDIIVGSPNFDNGQSNEGRVFIFHGASTGIADAPSLTLESNQVSSYFGSAVRNGGDFNNDGFDDIIIGADHFKNGHINEGKVFIYSGSATGLNISPMLTLEADQNEAIFGKSVSSADINNDGYSDIIVGANLFDDAFYGSGKIFIYHGSNCTTQIYYADYDFDGFGISSDSFSLCSFVPGVVDNNLDCNDLNFLQNPNTIWYIDADLDSFYYGTGSPINQCIFPGAEYSLNIVGGGDCNDSSFWSNPSMFEFPDLLDNDCDGLVNDGQELSYGGVLQANQINSNFGISVASLGDINGDGFDDLVVGASEFDNGQIDEGRAFIYHGSSSGISDAATTIFENNKTGSKLGLTVASAGDVNGDGFMDVMIGAPYYDNGGTGDAGIVYFYYGNPSGFEATPNLTIIGVYGPGVLGIHLAGGGDINGDGYDDVVLDTEQHAKVYYGSSSGISVLTHTTIYHINGFGPIEIAGDLNGDGYDDVIVGQYNYENGESSEGCVRVYYGSSSGLNSIAGIILEINISSAFFGYALDGAGDVNNDGYSDIIIGSYWLAKAYIYEGSATGISATPQTVIDETQPDAFFAFSVSGIGDINLDGYSDVMVGANYYDVQMVNNGRVTIYHGSASGIDTTVTSILFGDQSDTRFSRSMTGGGDFNGDGIPDLVIGDYEYSLGEANEGIVYKYYGNEICTPSPEICNTLDDNCNGLIDDGVSESISITAGGPIVFCQGGTVLLTAMHSGVSLQWKKNGINIPGATSTNYSVNKTGNYSCITTSGCDITESDPILVTVNKAPGAAIVAGGATTFCEGGSVTLTEATVAASNYQWYKGATAIPGATSTTYIATTAGNYRCRVTKVLTGCFKNSNTITVTVPCREEELYTDEIKFEIYPNPNNGNFTISIPNLSNIESNAARVEIYNSLGQVIYTDSLEKVITLNGIASGIYIIRVQYEFNVYEQKMIIQN